MFKSSKDRKGFFAAMKSKKEDQPDDDISMEDDMSERESRPRSSKGARIEMPHAGRKAKPIKMVGEKKLKKSVKPLPFKDKKNT